MRFRLRLSKALMETVQVRLSNAQLKGISSLVKRGIYPNRSEAVRDAVRKLLK